MREWGEYFFLKQKPIECDSCINLLQTEPAFGYKKCPGLDIVGTCPGTPLGRVPNPLSEENKQVMRFFGKIQIWLFDGMGAYKIEAITKAFEIYDIPKITRPLLFERLTAIVMGHAAAKNKESKVKD